MSYSRQFERFFLTGSLEITTNPNLFVVTTPMPRRNVTLRLVSRLCFLSWVILVVGATHVSAQSSLNLLDPKTVSLDELQTSHAQIRKGRGNIPELLVQTTPSEDYPNVSFVPKQPAWDVSETPLVEMRVRNTSDHDITVMLSLENEGTDGQQRCSADKIRVPQGEIATMRLVVGLWYGSASQTFNPRQVKRVKVLAEPSSRSHSFSILEIQAISASNEIDDILTSDYFANLQPFFGKGVNIGNTLEAPNEGEWGGTLQDEHLSIIREAGFDSIRLPVRWSAHASNRAPYRLDASFTKRVKHVVDEALRQKLKVVLNIHHYEEIVEKPATHRKRFIGLWRQIAATFADYPPELAFEVFNEPHGKMDADFWNQLAADSVQVIRQTNPRRWIVLGPVDWNAVSGLSQLKLPEGDGRIAMTFHYYSPMKLTHQGAPWLGREGRQWQGTRWTDSLLERTQVEIDFNRALRFGYEHNVPIYLGEFGTYEKAPMESRVTWTRAIVREATKRKMGYAYWEFYSGFGMFDPQRNSWALPLKRAVLPQAGR